MSQLMCCLKIFLSKEKICVVLLSVQILNMRRLDNKLKNLRTLVSKWIWGELDFPRSIRSPITFKEANILAKSWYNKRDKQSMLGSFIKNDQLCPSKTNALRLHHEPIQTNTGSTGSFGNFAAATPPSTVSQTLSPVRNIGKD